MKQETLEEAGKNYATIGRFDRIYNPPNFNKNIEPVGFDRVAYCDFMQGAKWQEDKIFEWLSSKDYLSDKVEVIRKEWFEQFKKK
jgi:hypothetical protein